MTKKRVRRRVGDIVAIPLDNNINGFGRILHNTIAFYDLQSDKSLPLEEIVQAPVLFRIWVMRSAVSSGHWPVLGNLPLEEPLLVRPMFIAIRTSPSRGEYYMTPDGSEIHPATFEQVKDLELLSVWEPETVEERLRDHFAGRPCVWVEMFKLWA